MFGKLDVWFIASPLYWPIKVLTWCDALPSPLLDPKGVQLCQIAEVVWDLEPLPASSTKGGEKGVLKAPG